MVVEYRHDDHMRKCQRKQHGYARHDDADVGPVGKQDGEHDEGRGSGQSGRSEECP